MFKLKSFSYMYFAILLVCSNSESDEDFENEPTFEEQPKTVTYSAPDFKTPSVSGSPYLVEWFGNLDAVGKKWIKSSGKKDDVEDSIAKYNGEWGIGLPSKVVINGDYGLIVKTKARHHAIATKLNRKFEFSEQKPLIVQYEVKYEDGQECGGGYIKLLSEGAELKLSEFTDKTLYTIMFGPDKCGSTSKVHFIIKMKNPMSGEVTEHHAKQPSSSVSSYFDDHKTHLYTLVIRPDETFTVEVDQSQIMFGSLLTDLEPPVSPPEMINDENDKKPEDWDEREKIPDETARKPDDWDETAPKEIEDQSASKPDDWLENEEAMVPDQTAVKPSDWDEEMDGVWEAPSIENEKCKGVSGCGPWKRPMISNPNYKGKWKRPMITNTNYKGKWVPKQIKNPNYFEPHPFSQLMPITALGIELWTMSANIIIDNIYVGSDQEAASSFTKETFLLKKAQESAYETATTPSEGFFQKIVGATEERPWLWAVYILSVLIPIIVIAIACFGRKSRPSAVHYKKTDEPQMDDDDEEMPNLVGDDDEELLQPDDVGEEGDKSDDGGKRSRSTSRQRTVASEEQNDDEEASVEHSSPKGKRIRQRKQD